MTMNEADTRANLIDPKLIEAGWGSVENSYIRREVVITLGRIIGGGKRGKNLSSDYVLEYQGRKLAAIEAKKESVSYSEGVRQAKDYAQRLQCRIGYATNGHHIYQIDMLTGEEKLVEQYLSPDELWQLTFDPNQRPWDDLDEPDFAAVWRKRFAEIPFESKGDWKPRYYQENAINNALDAIARGRNRVLLTLATGTGKTCIAFQITWKLFHSRWSLPAKTNPSEAKKRPRTLFLTDRNILANHAFNDFGAFGEDAIVRIEPDEIKKKGAVPKNASVFFTIFQTFMSGGKDEQGNPTPYFGEYPTDFFDLIIIDECHRGGANDESTWRDILNYFSEAVQLGLTATPKRAVNADTYSYFGDPVYSYALRDGINDGFLTPFKVVTARGTMDEYIYTPGDGVVVQGNPEPGRLYRESDFNRIITIEKREEKRIHYWMDLFNPKEKTIVFCASQPHAGIVRDMINQYAKSKGWSTNPNYCVRVTANDGIAGENDLKMFQDNEKTIPTILTTSRKLSTGVDARNVRNIVLMRPCNNMIEFKQIIGRGTRMYDGKDYFTIYDFVGAHQNFADPEWDGEPLEPEVCERCGNSPCTCESSGGPRQCQICHNHPCTCDRPEPEHCPECGQRPCVCEHKVVITLSDGRARQILHVSSTMYWSPDGTPITPREFLERMFDDLPQFFSDEEQLRKIWSDPTTREKLLEDLIEAGYDEEKLESMKELIDAKYSDVYDVLAYVAYAAEVRTRADRVSTALPRINNEYTDHKQQEFISFILNKYVEDGVQELAPKKMRSLIELKYNTITDAASQLGSPAIIRATFVGFQKYLYE